MMKTVFLYGQAWMKINRKIRSDCKDIAMSSTFGAEVSLELWVFVLRYWRIEEIGNAVYKGDLLTSRNSVIKEFTVRLSQSWLRYVHACRAAVDMKSIPDVDFFVHSGCTCDIQDGKMLLVNKSVTSYNYFPPRWKVYFPNFHIKFFEMQSVSSTIGEMRICSHCHHLSLLQMPSSSSSCCCLWHPAMSSCYCSRICSTSMDPMSETSFIDEALITINTSASATSEALSLQTTQLSVLQNPTALATEVSATLVSPLTSLPPAVSAVSRKPSISKNSFLIAPHHHTSPSTTTFPNLNTILLILLIFLVSSTNVTSGARRKVGLHALLPRHIAMTTELTREFRNTFINFRRDTRRPHSGSFRREFSVQESLTLIRHDSPKELLDAFCEGILRKHAVSILSINNPLGITRRTEANEYVLDLAQFLGIPVISWDTQLRASRQLEPNYRTVQFAPTIQHQAHAMVDLLQRYNWTSFSVVTAPVAGDSEFLSTLEVLVELDKKRVEASMGGPRRQSLEILSIVHISDVKTDVVERLGTFNRSDTRVFLLHCGSLDALGIIETAVKLGLTGQEYVWILTRSAIPIGKYGPKKFPVGLLGINFDYDVKAMKKFVRLGVKTWLHSLLALSQNAPALRNLTLPTFTCNSDSPAFWKEGSIIYDHVLNVKVPNEPQIVFNRNGTLQQTELIIVNLQWSSAKDGTTSWREVGRWMRDGLKMKDITWPGEAALPPIGKPKRAFLRVATLAEMPYVIYKELNAQNKCESEAPFCYVYPRDDNKTRLSNITKKMCCHGMSIDLLKILSEKLNFDYELKEVWDGNWGGFNKLKKEWNGLVKILLDDGADIVVTALKINPERASAILFSVPYLETGIKIIVALREGAISPTAFLEPFDFFSWLLIILLSVHIVALAIFLFELAAMKGWPRDVKSAEPYDYASWSLILIFSVHATGASILIFEWLSPYGLNRGLTPLQEHKFSLFRSFWLIWAMLFSTSVQTDSPRGIASRFLANIWALFALVFLASYTANLAAFMITKEQFYDLSGIKDYRIQNPHTMNPPFKYATIPSGSTEANIRANHEWMYQYMKKYNQPDVESGIAALKQEKIQAFIYDSSVLEYYESRDDRCRLVTVGNRYAMTGYGVGFPPDPSNPWIEKIDRVILKLQENGDLDRLQKFWLAGACDNKKEKGVSNRTLGILNFTSAFILLGAGVLLGIVIMFFEHLYFKFGRKYLRRWDKCGCCALVSLSMGKSLRIKDYVDEAMSLHARNRCKDPLCETQIWKLKHKLDLALLKIGNLQHQLNVLTSESAPLALPAPAETGEDQGVRTRPSAPQLRQNIHSKARTSGGGISNGSTASNMSHQSTTPLWRQNSSHLAVPSGPTARSPSSSSDLPEIGFMGGGGGTGGSENDSDITGSGSMVQKFERFFDDMDTFDASSDTEPWSENPHPPPYGSIRCAQCGLPRGSSQEGSNSSTGGLQGGWGTGMDGEGKGSAGVSASDFTYVDSHRDSQRRINNQNSPRDVSECVSPASRGEVPSPWPTLRRTASYTSAVGGSLASDLSSTKSPIPTRQFDGKTYMGVDGSLT